MITIEDLSFKYGRKEILSNISLTLTQGKIYGLLGENGVGKTTLLKIISGLQKPFSGTCLVNGESAFKRTPSFLSNIYYLPEDLEYIQMDIPVKLYAETNGMFYPRFDMQKFNNILNEFSMDANGKLNKLSQGQTKKVAIAFALATNVDLILMDEPSNGLDIPSKSLFRKVIAQYCDDNTCCVISTHQVRDLENLIDPIIILDNRAVLLNASLEKISENLYFGLEPSAPQDALYAEPTLGGVVTVTKNTHGMESRVNLEALFNATMQKKNTIQEIFK